HRNVWFTAELQARGMRWLDGLALCPENSLHVFLGSRTFSDALGHLECFIRWRGGKRPFLNLLLDYGQEEYTRQVGPRRT
ncbi:MAG TPA: hypothetical protein VHM88_07200, partial [Candidatus Acidoferrales bacterium]|nr:hypothetical protein [Candidatus Acidoferrales bacterium]